LFYWKALGRILHSILPERVRAFSQNYQQKKNKHVPMLESFIMKLPIILPRPGRILDQHSQGVFDDPCTFFAQEPFAMHLQCKSDAIA
jgi:hypothetical protein